MKAKIAHLPQIKEIIKNIDPIPLIEQGFAAYSAGLAVVPPVGELLFPDAPGEAHIKYGYIKEEKFFVIKVATGYYKNIDLGLPPGSGLMLIFLQQTGELAGILLDEGYLTDIRTAAAGAVAAKYMAPPQVQTIGILGAGVQGRMQLQFLAPLTPCRRVMVWNHRPEGSRRFKQEMEFMGYDVTIAATPAEVAQHCNLIVTTTPSHTPLLEAVHIKPGTHITAMGSDTPQKQELDPLILKNADLVVADSLEQSSSRGEIYKAVSAGILDRAKPIELGKLVSLQKPGRTSQAQITIADLTGVAVQDIQIAKAVFEAL